MTPSTYSLAQDIFTEETHGFMPVPGKMGDLDAALAVLAKAERLIEAQRVRIARLENLALTDETTGLINRRGFMRALQRELAVTRRDSEAHGVIVLFDLDNFKAINEAHGHAAGDAYLSAFGAALTAEASDSDIVARVGADEFGLLLTRTALKPGFARAAEITKSLHGKTMNWKSTTIPLRVSVGAAAYGGHGRSIAEAVMVSADLKLYADKERRRTSTVRV